MPSFAIDSKQDSNPIQFRAMFDLPSKLTVDYSGQSTDVDIDQGISLAVEYTIDKNYGVGAQYGIERKKVQVIPMYFFLKADSGKAGIQGNIGYSLLNVSGSSAGGFKVNGGLFIGCGVFMTLNSDVKLTADYSVCNGSMTYTDSSDSINLSYSRIQLGASLRI